MNLAEHTFKIKQGEVIELTKRDGLALLVHLLEFEKDINLTIFTAYGHRLKISKTK